MSSYYVLPLLLAVIVSIPPVKVAEETGIFEETDPLSGISILIGGFDINIPSDIPKVFSMSRYQPVWAVTVLPISNDPRLGSIRKQWALNENDKNLIAVKELGELTWYYICVEFKGRDHTIAKVTAACTFNRTYSTHETSYDPIGLVSLVENDRITDTAAQFKVTLDPYLDFATQLDFYFENGYTSTQSYMLHSIHPDGVQKTGKDHTQYNMDPVRRSRPRTLHVNFRNLENGKNHGRLCVREKPIKSQSYTSWGRLIDVSNTQCFNGDVITKKHPVGDDADSVQQDKAKQFRAQRRIDGDSNSESGATSTRTSYNQYLIAGVIMTVFGMFH